MGRSSCSSQVFIYKCSFWRECLTRNYHLLVWEIKKKQPKYSEGINGQILTPCVWLVLNLDKPKNYLHCLYCSWICKVADLWVISLPWVSWSKFRVTTLLLLYFYSKNKFYYQKIYDSSALQLGIMPKFYCCCMMYGHKGLCQWYNRVAKARN